MKKTIGVNFSLLLLLLLIGSIFVYAGQSKGISQGPLTQDEIDGLTLMREEEKLARDVYLTFHATYEQNIFANIAESEQRHTDAIKSLLDKYDLYDPMEVDEIGVFENQDLQELYDQLILQGSESYIDALIAGATIEDLDINDLEELSTETDREDILAVYAELEKGSRNHLRSYVDLILQNDGTYEPQFISEEEYLAIISSEKETGK